MVRFLSCRRTGPLQISKIDFGCGDYAILWLFQGQRYRNFQFMSEVRLAPLFIFEEQAYHTFRFDFRGESYSMLRYLKDRTITIFEDFGGEDSGAYWNENYRKTLKSI